MNEIRYEDLNKDFLLENNKLVIKVIKDEIDFYFKLAFKDNSDKLVIFSNGAYDPKKATPPIFMRSSWLDDYEFSTIFIDDRTVHNNGLRIGWGVGNKERHFLIDYHEILVRIVEIMNFNNENIYYYGSSAGGYMSIYLATLHKGTTAIVNNPQTYVTNYHRAAVEKLFEVVFTGMSEAQIRKNYAVRFSLTNAMKTFQNTPRIYYIQNARCQSDMKMHCTPFMEALKKYKIPSKKIQFIFYNNFSMGHNPISKEDTLRMINSAVNGHLTLNV
ncbi:MAG: glycosyl transferase [Macrococcus canis]|uniref:glycosyl transferase n=1 Tax=Macrococcoides canis TaxID=1855823 RepID=UPI00105DD43B|nr:glycosyl transferase [Macrococcus canis]MEE1108204.1 glycosyl transferase [Macrococcus canis]TDM36653.1 glycosyl transferase [Macrococcus canis]